MSDYSFYAGMLRFVAHKTEPADQRVQAMMAALIRHADAIETADRFNVAGDQLEITARAFAGVAAFLQKQILPEVVAAQNAPGERQVRWAIDTSMTVVNALLARAAQQSGTAAEIVLPAAPQ